MLKQIECIIVPTVGPVPIAILLAEGGPGRIEIRKALWLAGFQPGDRVVIREAPRKVRQ